MEYQQRQNDPADLIDVATLKTYFVEQVNTIEFILRKPQSKISEEDIHKLRIAIKRIRSLAEFILFAIPDFRSKKFLKYYNKIFSAAGKARELQLVIFMLKNFKIYDSVKNYADHLRKVLKKKKRRLFFLSKSELIHKLEKRAQIILPFFDAVSKNEVNRFLEAKANEIRKLIGNRDLKKAEVHRLRKILKELYYTALIFIVRDDQFKYIHDFQELIGQWHNNVVLKGYLEKAVNSGHLGNKENKIVKEVKQRITSESKARFEKIRLRILDMQQSGQKLEIYLQ